MDLGAWSQIPDPKSQIQRPFWGEMSAQCGAVALGVRCTGAGVLSQPLPQLCCRAAALLPCKLTAPVGDAARTEVPGLGPPGGGLELIPYCRGTGSGGWRGSSWQGSSYCF